MLAPPVQIPEYAPACNKNTSCKKNIISRKDIKQGELIVADTPLFIVPPEAHSQNKNKVK